MRRLIAISLVVLASVAAACVIGPKQDDPLPTSNTDVNDTGTFAGGGSDTMAPDVGAPAADTGVALDEDARETNHDGGDADAMDASDAADGGDASDAADGDASDAVEGG